MREVKLVAVIALILTAFAVTSPEVSSTKLLSCEEGTEATGHVFRIQRFAGFDHVVSSLPFQAQLTRSWDYPMHDMRYDAGALIRSLSTESSGKSCYFVYGLPPAQYILKDENGKDIKAMGIFYDFTATVHVSQLGTAGPMGVVMAVLPGQYQLSLWQDWFDLYGNPEHAARVWERVQISVPYELVPIPARGDE